MDAEATLMWVDQLLSTRTGERLNALQKDILKKVLRGQKYLEIAAHSGYTEGHIKDVGSHLWRILSRLLGERVTKTTCRSILERYLQTQPLAPVAMSDALPHQRPLLGREAALDHLDSLIQTGCNVIVIQGEGGLGKTTLAQHYLQTHGFEVVLELLMAKETSTIASAERVVEEWLSQDLQQEPGLEFGVTLGRLKRQLHTRRIGILIDNLEPALDSEGRFLPAHRSYVELLRVLTDTRVQSVTVITSRDRLCEPSLAVTHYRLPRLDQSAWQQFFSQHYAVDTATLEAMHQAYGGNAKSMGILCGVIWEDFAGDMTAYWSENQQDLLATTDLKNLVVSQFDRLQTLDPSAYRLLCRLGCYRYQDMPTISTEGLRYLLWDVPAERQRQVMTSLKNRSLVEFAQGQYWLHPALQVEAIARLRPSEDWMPANQAAAEFWTAQVQTIENTQQALQALEAYYHYLAIQDFEAASGVILKSRNNQWGQFLPLGSTLYRMGLLQPVLAAITQVIPHLQSTPKLSELYNILGDLYWITGKLEKAIACQEKTIALATETLQSLIAETVSQHQIYYLRMLEVDSLLSIGLYNIDLWELKTAAQLFQQVIDRATHTAHHAWAEKASICLALVHSYLGLSESARTLANAAYDLILKQALEEQTGRFAYFIQILGQTYVNLGEFEQASTLYSRALEFAEASHYTQVKARILIGLAEIDRYYQCFDSALAYHTDAIELLEQIGATCDLAEAYWQLGLTYQQMHQIELCRDAMDRALNLFQQMDAKHQVEKVRLSLLGL